jgi:hypothetical protein
MMEMFTKMQEERRSEPKEGETSAPKEAENKSIENKTINV